MRGILALSFAGVLALTFAAACSEDPSGGTAGAEAPPTKTSNDGAPPPSTTDLDGSRETDASAETPSDAASGDAPDAGVGPQVSFPRTGITADELGVVINDSDSLSVAVAAYSVTARSIPASHIVHLSIPNVTANDLSKAAFAPLKAKVDSAFVGTPVQALLIT